MKIDNAKERAIQAANPNMHWTDVMMMANKTRVIDLREIIQSRMQTLCSDHIASAPSMSPNATANKPLLKFGSIGSAVGIDSIQRISAASPSPRNSTTQIMETNREQNQDDDDDVANNSGQFEKSKIETIKMKSGEFVLQYGPETVLELAYLLTHSFKVFWDGSISLYKDTVCSSTNNKEFLNKLLDIRMASDQHQEPPVTLIHGQETEVTLRETLMRIKVEQAEEMERMKQKALEQEEES